MNRGTQPWKTHCVKMWCHDGARTSDDDMHVVLSRGSTWDVFILLRSTVQQQVHGIKHTPGVKNNTYCNLVVMHPLLTEAARPRSGRRNCPLVPERRLRPNFAGALHVALAFALALPLALGSADAFPTLVALPFGLP